MNGNSKVTYNDVTIGLPALMICVEAVVFMVANHFVFNAKPYHHTEKAGAGYSFVQALLDVMSPMDLIRSIGQAVRRRGA